MNAPDYRAAHLARVPPQEVSAVVWVFAVMVPVLAGYLSAAVRPLHSVPYSLSFLTICLIAGFISYKPAVLTAILAVVANGYFQIYLMRVPLSWSDIVRSLVTFCAALIVCGVLESRRRAHLLCHEAWTDLSERTDALVDSLHAGKCASWIIDLESGKSTRWYSGSYQVFGVPFSELEKHASLVNFIDAEDRPRFLEMRASMHTSRNPLVFEFRCSWPNGEQHWLEMRATRVHGDVGCVWRGVTMDITERKRAETAVLRQEKLAAMGRMASTVAHEINNPLEAVTNLLYLANLDETLSSGTKSYLGMAETELARLSEITRLTLGYARNTAVKQPLVLADSVEDVLKIFRHRYQARNIRISLRFDGQVSVVLASHELRQILINLISNAADAVTANDAKDRRIGVDVHTNGSHAILEISDNGSGVSAEALPHIFEPFFTTKGDVGTGIGLWVTRELVESNGGKIAAESGDLADGMKTRLRVEFPISDGSEVAQA